jgi:hypothetical protein
MQLRIFTSQNPAYADLPDAIVTTPNVTSVKTSNYVAVVRDVVRCATDEDGLTVTLPACTGNAGQIITIKKVNTDTTSVEVVPTGGNTIDGALNNQVSGLRATRTFMSDGDSNWMVVY